MIWLLVRIGNTGGFVPPAPTRKAGWPGRVTEVENIDKWLAEGRPRLQDKLRELERAAEAAKPKIAKALNKAAEASADILEDIAESPVIIDTGPLDRAMAAAAGARTIKEAMARSQIVIGQVNALRKQLEDEEEEEAIVLLALYS
jgi:tetrahydromethanopterin S-methyltransferase subunit H